MFNRIKGAIEAKATFDGESGVTAEGHPIPSRKTESHPDNTKVQTVYDGKNGVTAEGHTIPSRYVTDAPVINSGTVAAPPQQGRNV